MRCGAFEIQTVAGLELVVALIVKPDLEFAAENMKEFFAIVGIRFTAAATGLDAEEVRLHGSVAPGKKLHADVGAGFEDLAVGGMDQSGSIAIGLEKRQKVSSIKSSDAPERGDGRAHLAALERAEKADRDAGGTGDLGERKTALETKAAESLARRLPGIGGSEGEALLFQNMNNGGGVQAASAAQEDGALK